MELPEQLDLPLKPGKGADAAEHHAFRGTVMTLYRVLRGGGARFADAQFAALCGIKLRTFQHWKRRWKKDGAAGLKPRSRRPHTSRPSMLADPKLRDIAVRWRKKRNGGARPLMLYLAARHGIKMSLSLAKRLLAQLREEKRIEPLYAGSKRVPLTGKRKRKAKCDADAVPYQRPHPEQLLPGERVQMDTMFVRYRHGHLAFIRALDVRSRRTWLSIVHQVSAAAASALLRRVAADCGGVKVAQVDGGGEFRGELAECCRQLGIARMVNPKGSPKCNAFVESFNGTARREFVNALPHDISAPELRRRAAKYERYYNHERPHSSLGDETPIMVFNRLAPRPDKNRNMY